MSWRDVVRAVAPALGSALTAANPLAGAAVAAIGRVVLADDRASEADIERAMAGPLPPEVYADLAKAGQDFELRCRELGVDLARINADVEKAAMADTAHARETHKGDSRVYALAIAVLLTFAVTVSATLAGIYSLLTGGIRIEDVGIVAAVFTLLGSVVGYVAANAQQVVSFFFGSSLGSKDKGRDLAAAVQAIGKRT